MYIEWNNLKPVKKSLETFLEKYITLEKIKEEDSHHCWAEFRSEIQILYDPTDRNLSEKVKSLLSQIQDQKMEVFFHREYKVWYTVIKIGKEIWAEESLYYATLDDLWGQILLKIESFCYKDLTSGFNVTFFESVQQPIESALSDYDIIMGDSSAELE